ncbi:MAG: HEAT repeat domain-containing protein [Theionarchaea archaeon]|nr:HEAT repeat domain-containing protein [Theionarchaea archaeon]
MRNRSTTLGISCILIAVTLLSLCIGQPPEPTPSPTQESEYDVSAIIDKIDVSDPQSYHAAEELVSLGRPAVPALLGLLNSLDPKIRWAAIYALSRLALPEDIEDLAKGLDDPDVGIQVITAATLLGLGDERGTNILEEAANSDLMFPYTNPPDALGDYASWVLEQGTQAGSFEPEGTLDEVSPITEPNDGVTVDITECTIDMTMNLQFMGDGATEKLASMWADAITEMWSGKSSAGCTTKVTVNTLIKDEYDPLYFPVIVKKMLHPGAQHVSYVWYLQGEPVCCEWDSNDTGFAVAHEAGHMLGLSDDPPGNSNLSIMSQVCCDAEGNPPEAKPQHIDEILRNKNLQCPEECRPDLIVGVTATPQTPKINTVVVVTAVVTNEGKLDVTVTFSVDIFVDGNLVKTEVINGLEKDKSTSVNYTTTFSKEGNHTVKVHADSGNTVEESNEANNERTIALTVTKEDKPDLTITDITVRKEMGSPGDAVLGGDIVTFIITVENQGTQDAKGFTVTLDVRGIVQDDTIKALSAGGKTTVEFMYKVAYPGENPVKATVDPDNKVEESNEKNNVKETSLMVGSGPGIPSSPSPSPQPPSQYPDLVVTYVRVEWVIYTVPYQIHLFGVEFTVTNYGTNCQGPIKVNVWLDNQSTVVGTYTYTGSLSQGQSFSYTVTMDVPVSDEQHIAGVTVDPQNMISESNENNNTMTKTFPEETTPPPTTAPPTTAPPTTTPPPPKPPDLAVTYVRVQWVIYTLPYQMSMTGVEFTVKNFGGDCLEPIQVSIWLDNPSNTIGTYIHMGSLLQGESFHQALTLDIPISDEEHVCGVFVDPYNAISESNEGNNTLTKTFPEGGSNYLVTRGLLYPVKDVSMELTNRHIPMRFCIF